jgi:hypothetical protein
MKGQNPAVSGAMDGGANEAKRTSQPLLGAGNFILDKSDGGYDFVEPPYP